MKSEHIDLSETWNWVRNLVSFNNSHQNHKSCSPGCSHISNYLPDKFLAAPPLNLEVNHFFGKEYKFHYRLKSYVQYWQEYLQAANQNKISSPIHQSKQLKIRKNPYNSHPQLSILQSNSRRKGPIASALQISFQEDKLQNPVHTPQQQKNIIWIR